MAVITIMKKVKEIHPEEIALVKVGNFYQVFGKIQVEYGNQSHTLKHTRKLKQLIKRNCSISLDNRIM